jgi:methylated-DNA-[protein]-cysteine S-methyltransferase
MSQEQRRSRLPSPAASHPPSTLSPRRAERGAERTSSLPHPARHYFGRVESPVGPLVATVDEEGRLVRLAFDDGRDATPAGAVADAGRCGRVIAQLREYLAGERRDFDLVLAPRGTASQQRVWEELTRIPYGATISYRELARRVGNPAATRAVARANATNPLPVVVPCHRVIGSDGTLTGYGGGLHRKRFLLALEGASPSPQPELFPAT